MHLYAILVVLRLSFILAAFSTRMPSTQFDGEITASCPGQKRHSSAPVTPSCVAKSRGVETVMDGCIYSLW